MAEFFVMLFTLAVSFTVAYFLILRVPALLHTPLMSMTNAVSGVTILGALLVFTAEMSGFELAFGVAAVVAAGFNLVGGFIITERMLRMFKKRREGGEENTRI